MQERDFSRALLQGDACTVIIAYNLAFTKWRGRIVMMGRSEKKMGENRISIDLWIYESP